MDLKTMVLTGALAITALTAQAETLYSMLQDHVTPQGRIKEEYLSNQWIYVGMKKDGNPKFVLLKEYIINGEVIQTQYISCSEMHPKPDGYYNHLTEHPQMYLGYGKVEYDPNVDGLNGNETQSLDKKLEMPNQESKSL